MRLAPVIELGRTERETLNRWAQGRSKTVRQKERAEMILMAAAGKTNLEIADLTGVKPHTVGRWRQRFAELRLEGITKELPRGGRPRCEREEIESEVIRITTMEAPKNATHWSTRTLARRLGVSQSMVHRIWRANGLKPNLVRTFKLSNEPNFEENFIDVVGLYLNPPDRALVLSAGGKIQIQALDRRRPSLPVISGRCGTLTHDHKRNETTALFAAIDMAQGKVRASCMSVNRHQVWVRFLRQIYIELPPEMDLHLIVDHYATHKHPNVKAWLKRHPRFHVHFIPTGSSWLNIVEWFFHGLEEKRGHRGVFRSISELTEALTDYIEQNDTAPNPFVWKKHPDEIIEKAREAKWAPDNFPTD